MATTFPVPQKLAITKAKDGEFWHKFRMRLSIVAAAALITAVAVQGFDYYRMDLTGRAESPLHAALRPSGTIGVRLGILGFVLYLVLFLYPIRKHWKWLGTIGKTRHWLDFHVVVGMTAPILVTFHAAFKLSGVAGVAYWIMIAVAVSGIVGRYMYAQIPRSLNTAQLTFSELDTQAARLASEIERQEVFRPEEIAPLFQVPTPDQVRRMPLAVLLWTILRLDLARPFLVSRLRRRVLRGSEIFTTLGGFRASSHPELETVIATVRQQSRLRAKMTFLERIGQAFLLWHVVHRPFSYSFAVLVTVHIGVVLMLGYF
jgi:hypothetical protein